MDFYVTLLTNISYIGNSREDRLQGWHCIFVHMNAHKKISILTNQVVWQSKIPLNCSTTSSPLNQLRNSKFTNRTACSLIITMSVQVYWQGLLVVHCNAPISVRFCQSHEGQGSARSSHPADHYDMWRLNISIFSKWKKLIYAITKLVFWNC